MARDVIIPRANQKVFTTNPWISCAHENDDINVEIKIGSVDSNTCISVGLQVFFMIKSHNTCLNSAIFSCLD